MDRIIGSIEPYGLADIAAKMGFGMDELGELLRANGVKFESADQSLREIAKINNEKIFFILVLLIEMKFGKASER